MTLVSCSISRSALSLYDLLLPFCFCLPFHFLFAAARVLSPKVFRNFRKLFLLKKNINENVILKFPSFRLLDDSGGSTKSLKGIFPPNLDLVVPSSLLLSLPMLNN